MNFFEQQMRAMFENVLGIEDEHYIGKTMIAKIDDDLRVKTQFVSTHIAKHYDAIRVRIINRTEGEVDTETILFGDIIGQKDMSIAGKVNPYMWEESIGKAYWYTPISAHEFDSIVIAVLNYISQYKQL